MPGKVKNILKCNHGKKSIKAPFIVHADTEPLLEEINIFHNNPEK